MSKLRFWFALILPALSFLLSASAAQISEMAPNFFSNPGFELGLAEEGWHLDKAGSTNAEFTVDRGDAAEGRRSARITIKNVADWGTRFGQSFNAGQKGKAYTFAVMARSTGGPVEVRLQIERRAKPWDRAAASEKFTLKKEAWTELHVTFKLEKDFSQGWFAYIACTQPNCEYRADMFRLYEGEYVPYSKLVQKEDAATGAHLFDVGDSSTSVSNESITSRVGWKQIEGAKSPTANCCIANNYLALVFQRDCCGAQYYYRMGEQMVKGSMLVPVGANGQKAVKLKSFRAIQNTPAKVVVEVVAATTDRKKIVTRFAVQRNRPVVETFPGDGAQSLLVQAQTEHLVLPDPLGGDVVVPIGQFDKSPRRLPSENMLLQLGEQGNVIVVTSWRSRQQSVHASNDGVRVDFDRENGLGVNVSALAAAGIWHQQSIADLDPVKDKQLDWKVPYRAQWRAVYRRTDGLCDSWRCIFRKSKNDYESFGITIRKARTVWTSPRGTFAYPVCIEGESAYARNTKYEGSPEVKNDPAGSVVFYPFARMSGSPENDHGVLDILDLTLQDTAEASYIDQMQIKHVPRDRWPATCAVTAEYEKIFSDKEEKTKKAELLKRLSEMDNFVINIRSRMDEYLSWSRKVHEFCVQQKANAKIAALAEEFDDYVSRYQKVYEDLKLNERTPAAAKALIQQVIALIDNDELKKDEKANLLGRQTRTIGGSQDTSIGKFRNITKEIRQRAAYRMIEAKDAASFQFLKTIRDLTIEMLQCGFGHEGAFTE